MGKHTAGPWESARMLVPTKDRDKREGFVVNASTVMEDEGSCLAKRICDIRYSYLEWSEASANARLIAAAPALLDALVAVVQWIEDNAPRQGDPQAEWCDQLDLARVAIAQAEGRTDV